MCQKQTCLGYEALWPAYLPIREGGLGFTINSSNSVKGCPSDLPSLLELLLERPKASALLKELKTLATEVKRSQIEDAVGSKSSWAALAAEEGSGLYWSKREQEEGGGNSENNRRIEGSVGNQPERGNELSQTNRSVREVCVRVVPRVQLKLSRAHSAYPVVPGCNNMWDCSIFYFITFRHYPRGTPGRGARGSLRFTA